MKTFKELRKAVHIQVNGEELKVAVLGNTSTQFLSMAIEGRAKLEGININVMDTDYNQIDMQLLDDFSEVYSFNPRYIILWLSTEKLYEEFLDMSFDKRETFADYYCDKIEHYWRMIEKKSNATIFQFNFTEIDDKVMGNFSAKVKSTFTYQIRKLNYLISMLMEKEKRVFPVDIFSIQIQLGHNAFYDAKYYYNAKMAVSMDALPYIAKAVVDMLKSQIGKIKKCMVLDLDNTLWGGVIGDDGIEHIEIGELGRGHAFTNFQRWLKQLKEYGIILAVCSKNNEEIAKKPFVEHEEMILRMSDISLFVANWENKAINIKLIQESLNIGMDQIVFVDDNIFERNLVRNALPGIEVPELPDDPALYLEFLQSKNYFEVSSYVGVAQDRTELYKIEFERQKLQKKYESIDEYLKSLEMAGYAGHFEVSRYSRIAQLTQRSNQFNLRTIRYTEDEVRKIAESDDYITMFFTLKDRFGDYGLVGVVIMKKVSSKELFIDTWLMSCRVLKRGMEEYIVNTLIKEAKKSGFDKVIGEYIPTEKNKMVEKIYETMGFTKISDNLYEMDVKKYEEHTVFIEDEQI